MKLRLVILVLLAAVGFFNPYGKFSEQLIKLMLYLSIMAAFAYGYLKGKDLGDTSYPRKSIVIILVSIFISAFMASAFHMQTLTTSLMSVLPFALAYAFFLALMMLDVEPDSIMKAMIVLLIASGVVYFANLVTFPNNIFGEPILAEDTSRGIVRIKVVFCDFLPVMALYSLNKFRLTQKKTWLAVTAYAVLMTILSVARQLMVYTAFLCMLMYLRHVSWKVRIITVVVIVGLGVALFNTPMFQAMVSLTEQQMEENDDTEDPRIAAWRYYTYENQTNTLSFFLGNGVPSLGNSRWGIQFDSETEDNGCFAADVGWAGFYWYFGIFATLALLYMLVRAVRKKYPDELEYVPYAAGFFILSPIASGSNLYYYQIVLMMIVLYVAYRTPGRERIPAAATGGKPKVPDTPGYAQLPSGPSLPQL